MLLRHLVASLAVLSSAANLVAQDASRIVLDLEIGPVWQSRNDVQIPNDATGTRFSLVGLVGDGPWVAGRFALTWNISDRHALGLFLAPLSLSGTGSLSEPVAFAGETYQPSMPVEATYEFNSWRLGYRYRALSRETLAIWIGFTAKVRDAKIELRQASVSSKDTDVGFVPLLHLAADWQFARRWRAVFDFDGLAGGPGRAFDVALTIGRDLGSQWGVRAGYRTLEGGADVESVYNFAWLHYAIVATRYRF